MHENEALYSWERGKHILHNSIQLLIVMKLKILNRDASALSSRCDQKKRPSDAELNHVPDPGKWLEIVFELEHTLLFSFFSRTISAMIDVTVSTHSANSRSNDEIKFQAWFVVKFVRNYFINLWCFHEISSSNDDNDVAKKHKRANRRAIFTLSENSILKSRPIKLPPGPRLASHVLYSIYQQQHMIHEVRGFRISEPSRSALSQGLDLFIHTAYSAMMRWYEVMLLWVVNGKYPHEVPPHSNVSLSHHK